MKTILSRIRRKDGVTLIELIIAILITTFVFMAILAFINFASTSTGVVMVRSQVQGEMRLIMRHINNEVTIATGATIIDADVTLLLEEEQLLLGFQGVGSDRVFSIRSGDPAVSDIVFNLSSDVFSLSFEPVGYNLVRVSMLYDDGDGRMSFELVEDVLMPNLHAGNYIAGDPNGSTFYITTLLTATGPPVV
jgi:hypothetical protein